MSGFPTHKNANQTCYNLIVSTSRNALWFKKLTKIPSIEVSFLASEIRFLTIYY